MSAYEEVLLEVSDGVAVGLWRELIVIRAASIADDRPDDEPLDDEEDDGRDPEDEVVQIADVLPAVRDRLGREEAGGHALADPDRVKAEDDHRDDPDDQDGTDHQGDDRG